LELKLIKYIQIENKASRLYMRGGNKT